MNTQDKLDYKCAIIISKLIDIALKSPDPIPEQVNRLQDLVNDLNNTIRNKDKKDFKK
jgi:tetrahydromethanopterin S-methyltransferase subunit B